jgi:hypothetical protein
MQRITRCKSPYQSGTVYHCSCNNALPLQDKRAEEEVKAQPHAFSISALDKQEIIVSRPDIFTLGEIAAVPSVF